MDTGKEMDVQDQSGPTVEGLVEEIKTLKTTVEDLKRETLKQKKVIKKLKTVFQREWSQRFEEYKLMKKKLGRLLKEEEELKMKVEQLKTAVSQRSREVREKDEQAQECSRKLKKLMEADGNGGKSNNLKVALISGGNSERKAAVSVFPEEVWKLILDKLTDPKDLWNCSNACQLFEDILRPWKSGWMWKQALPHIYRHLPGNKLLETRLVSKGWNNAVDSFLDSHPSILPYSDDDTDPRRLDFVYPIKEKEICKRNIFSFGPDEDISFLKALVPNKFGRNPIIGRYVALKLWNDEHDEDTLEVEEERWTKLYNFLETFGKEIWHLSCYFPESPSLWLHGKITHLFTVTLFPLVPNLRKLFIFKTSWDTDIDPETIPPAPHFKTLETDYMIGDGINDAYLQRFHTQLNKVQLSTWIGVFEWPSLTELQVLFEENMEVNPTQLGESGSRMPNLNKLTLEFELADMITYHVSISTILTMINQLSLTTRLNTVKLIGPRFQCEQLETTLAATPKLETLDVLIESYKYERSNIIPSFNFLRGFPFIRNLNIHVSRPHDGWVPAFDESDLMPNAECKARAKGMQFQEELVQVNKYAYDGELYKSNVWELLPRLKVLTFQWDVYTREGYEAYCKNALF